MNPRPRWLLMAGHVPSTLSGGGIVRYTVELVRALAERDDLELHVTADPSAAEAVTQLVGGHGRVHVQPRIPSPLVAPWERWGMGRWLGDRFNVVHGVKHLLPRGVRARTVLTVHDMLLFDRAADYPIAKRSLLRKPYEASLRQADHLVCVSDATRDRLAAWMPQTLGRAGVVRSATGSALLHAEPVAVPEVAGRHFALVVGDPSPRKNLGTVISAWARIQHPDACLVLVGPPAWGASAYGPDHARLTASGRLVQLVGVPDAQLRWLYEHAAVVLAPSLAEGFGLPAVEALDLGAPLVTSDDPALVEVSGAGVPHLPATDVAAWARVVEEHLARGPHRSAPRVARTWSDVAAETVAEVMRGPRGAGTTT